MYIREIQKKNPNSPKVFISHRLIESVRTPRGPRQKAVINLGQLDLPKENWKELANRIEDLLRGYKSSTVPISARIETLARHYTKQILRKQRSEKKEAHVLENEQDFRNVDINAVSSSDGKSIGSEHAGLEAMKALGFFDLFRQLGFTDDESNLATLQIVGRLVHPGSERELRRYAKEQSALDELLGTDFSSIGHNMLYHNSDLLFKHKETIERFLRMRSRELFSLGETIVLYDLTNTYFSGSAAGYKKAKRGRSKQKRSDRPLVTLGVVLDERGFIKCSRIFDGNAGEPLTLVDMINDIHSQVSRETPPLLVAKPTIVMDAGIASEDNLNLVRENGFSYIVVSRSKPEHMEDGSFEQIKEGIKVKEMHIGNETFLHCISDGKMKKEQAIVNKARDALEQEIEYLSEGLNIKRRLKSYPKVLERIGRLRQRYSRVSKGFSIDVKEHKGKAVKITWHFNQSQLGKPYDGSYFIRTDRMDLSKNEIWSLYIMLTLVEDAFRCLKGELGLRPNHHRKADRIEGHLFISILAYHLLNYIRQNLRKAGINHRWTTVRTLLQTHMALSTHLPTADGKMVHLRYCSIPTPRQVEVYSAMGITSVPLKRTKVEI
ncbi:MAG: IS1634 family transposase [Planctomycetota bacterium]|nr:MAG: IS1634 family transposase [Planctomycetota bacterium]